jgi:hypothetical protein
MSKHFPLFVCSLIALSLIGCQAPSAPPRNPWSVVPQNSDAKWVLLPESSAFTVERSQDDARYSSAIDQLATSPAIALTEAQAADLTQGKIHSHGLLHPYLVRGVAYGGASGSARVWRDENTGDVWIHQLTWNGENLFGVYATRDQLPCPLVVLLPSPPRQVFASAVVGGDGVFMHAHNPPTTPP